MMPSLDQFISLAGQHISPAKADAISGIAYDRRSAPGPASDPSALDGILNRAAPGACQNALYRAAEGSAAACQPSSDPLIDKTTIRELNNAQSIVGQVMYGDLKDDPDALFNPKRAAVDLKHEKAEHRVIILLKAQGFSNIEIARQLGYSPVSINYIVNQPWAQKRIVEEIHRAGRDEVETILKGTLLDSINVLIEIQSDKDGKPSDRRSAAEYLIDRVLGKAKQSIDHNLQRPLGELSDAELEAIAKGTTMTATAAMPKAATIDKAI